jgi:hypothetical protein
MKIDPMTHDSYSAWREGAHDDPVLELATACWRGERQKPTSRAAAWSYLTG